MKDYSDSVFGKKDYILCYRIVEKEYDFSSGNVDVKGKRIIVTYADKSEKTFDYSQEMENSIIKQMEDQVLYAEPMEISRLTSIMSGAEIPFIAYNVIKYVNTLDVINLISLSLLGVSELAFGALFLAHNQDKKEIDKMHYYLENKYIINYKFQNADLDSLRLSKKAKNEISDKRYSSADSLEKFNETFKIDLNNIEKFSLKDLIKIRKSIVNEDYEYGDDEEFVDTFDDNEGYVLRRGPHSKRSYFRK